MAKATADLAAAGRRFCAVVMLLGLAACAYHKETPLELTPQPTAAETAAGAAYGPPVPVRALAVQLPAAGEPLFALAVKRTVVTNGFTQGPFLAGTNRYIAGTDMAPWFAQALARVVAVDPDAGIELLVDPDFELDAEVTRGAWYEWYDHRTATVTVTLNLRALDDGKVILDKAIAGRSTEDFTWSLQETPSDELMQRLMRQALDAAVAEMGRDDDLRRLGAAI